MSDELLTTAEAARIAGVGTSSVKRWADQNLLRCVRTAGGHRRFYRADLDRFMQEHGDTLAGSAPQWLELFLHGGLFELQGELFRARDRRGAWHAVGSELGSAIAELGAAWQRGEVTVIEEHLASEKVARALQRVVESIPSADSDPRCLLATAEGDEHTLGLSLVELCLREAGFAALWSGRGTPTAELVELVRAGGIQMVAISASLISSNAGRLADQAGRLGSACRAQGAELLLGGAGAWPEPPPYGAVVRDLATLHRLAVDARPALVRAR
jgi:excisionase family DNA binding protein